MVQELTNAHPYIGMPTTDTQFIVSTGSRQWGTIRAGGPCKDDYKRIVIEHAPKGNAYVKLQKAAAASFLAASADVGFFIECTGSWRSCQTAHILYAQDPNRYAPADKGAHMRGLAIDVTTVYPAPKQKAIHDALLKRGWHQARPDDEPWHYSFGLQV